MDSGQMLTAVVRLASAREALDALFELRPRPWVAAVQDCVDAALEHADRALDAAIIAAVGSGVTVQSIESAAGITVAKPEWF